MFEGTVAVERSPRLRAKVTNNLWQSPDGLDQRSPRGRRWRDLLDGLIAEYGTSYPEKLRSLAVLKLSLEATQEAVLRGDILRSEDIVRLENLIGRRERELGARARARLATAPSSAAAAPAHDLTQLSNSQFEKLFTLHAESFPEAVAEALRKAAEALQARGALGEPQA